MTAPSGAPRVVHLPGNDVLSDARVLKYLATTARLGLETYAVGVARRTDRSETTVGDAHVVVVPVQPSRRHPLVTVLGAVRGGAALAEARGAVARLRASAGCARGVRRAALRGMTLVSRVWIAGADRLPPGARLSADTARARRIGFYRRWPALARWRSVLPFLREYDRAVGPVLDRIAPDVIHVHDVFMLGAASAAVERARSQGRSVRLVYDAHEYLPGLAVIEPRVIGAYCSLEREFIRGVDRVVTVSEPLADALVEGYRLRERPVVVLNAPTVVAPPASFSTVRETVGLPPQTPLLVYAGGVNRARGVDTAVRALPALPKAALVLVANKDNVVVREALSLAAALDVADRVHVVPFVAPELVVPFLSTATVGLSTLLRAPNHDMAVTNKFCEYLLAGLPIVTSDTPAQADLVRRHGLGEIYVAGDATSLADAVRRVLDDLPAVSQRVRGDEGLGQQFSWTAQARVVRDLYAGLLGELPARAWSDDALLVTSVSPRGR